jgi:hypothetical protein
MISLNNCSEVTQFPNLPKILAFSMRNKQTSPLFPLIALIFICITMCHIPKMKQKFNNKFNENNNEINSK